MSNIRQTSDQTKETNEDHLFKVPKLPKRLCSKHKKESSVKNLVDKLIESHLTNDESIVKDLIKDEIIEKRKKKKKKDDKEHKCSKHRKRKDVNNISIDKKISKHSLDSSSISEHQVNDDFFQLNNRTDDYHENERNYSSRSSSKRPSSYYDQLDNRYNSDDHSRSKKYAASSNYYNKSQYKSRYYDDYEREHNRDYDRNFDKEYDREYNRKYDRDYNRDPKYQNKQNAKDNNSFDSKDPAFMRKLRAENSISDWTKFCSRISKEAAEERDDDQVSICSGDFYSDDDDKRSIISERILNRDSLKSREIKFEIRDFKSKQVRTNAEIKQELLQQFPVSYGLNHWQEVEKPTEKNKKEKKKDKKPDAKDQELEDKVNDFLNKHTSNQNSLDSGFDIGSIMSQRLSALKVLEKDENNITALKQLKEANDLINEWSLAKSSGQNESNLNSNQQSDLATAEQSYETCKDFTKAAKSKHGIGTKLLQKMGWLPGQG